jgi:hypothetical protein
MRRIAITITVTAGVLLGGATLAFTQPGLRVIREALTGVQEVPVVSTTGTGTLRARISSDEQEISYTLTFRDLEGDVRQSHIHIGPEQNTGNIVLWLCQTATNVSPVATTPQCFDPSNLASARSNTVSGVLSAADIAPTAVPNGIAAGEFAEVIALIRAGKTYVNVHSVKFPPGEIRSQIGHEHQHDD